MLENGVPHKYFKEVLEIDKTSKTGLRWKKRENATGNFNTLFAGKEAGFVQIFGSNKYHIVKVAYKGRAVNFPAHRIVMILAGKRINGKIVKHKDGDGLNNSLSNLEICTQSEFLSGRKIQKNNHSGFKNVVKIGENKFVAQFWMNGKKHYVGYFDTGKKANQAVLAKRKQLSIA